MKAIHSGHEHSTECTRPFRVLLRVSHRHFIPNCQGVRHAKWSKDNHETAPAPTTSPRTQNSNGPYVLWLKRFLLADEQPFVPRSLASVDRTYRHRGSSAIPPSASLYRERMTLYRVSRLALLRLATDRFWREAAVGSPSVSVRSPIFDAPGIRGRVRKPKGSETKRRLNCSRPFVGSGVGISARTRVKT
jgi:hypothetical protein